MAPPPQTSGMQAWVVAEERDAGSMLRLLDEEGGLSGRGGVGIADGTETAGAVVSVIPGPGAIGEFLLPQGAIGPERTFQHPVRASDGEVGFLHQAAGEIMVEGLGGGDRGERRVSGDYRSCTSCTYSYFMPFIITNRAPGRFFLGQYLIF